jgi:hypothetical protein
MQRRHLISGATGLAIAAGLPKLAAAASLPPAPAPLGPNTFGSVQTRIPFCGANIQVTGTYTICGVFTAEAAFDWVRPVFLNESASVGAITAVSIAPSSTLNDGANPTNASGVADNTLWVPVYFNNGGSDASPLGPNAALPGTVRNVTQPAGVAGQTTGTGNLLNPSVILGDWTKVQSLARLDGGTLPLVFIRVYTSTNYGAGALPAVSFTAFDAVASGRIVRGGYVGGDSATTPGTITAPVQTTSYMASSGMQFISRARGLSVMAVGDSLFQGFGTDTYQDSPYHIACAALSTPTTPVIFANRGYQGRKSTVFHAEIYTLAPVLRPDVLIIKPESPNDGVPTSVTSGPYAVSLANAFALCDWCVRRGIVPVLATAQPWALSGSAETARQALNTIIRNSGWLYVDHDAAVRDPANTAAILSAYNSSARPPHYNDAGAAAIAVYAQQVLSKILATRPR